MKNLIYSIKKRVGLSYYSEAIGREKANEILYKKVQNPYDTSSPALLIDILLNTSMDSRAIRDVFHSYGIEHAKDGVDITGHAGLEYMLYHGKKYHYRVDGENITIDKNMANEDVVPDVLPIIPNSHLEHIQHLVASSKEGFNSYFGQAAEFSIKRQLEEIGYKVILPTDRNVEAVDLYVSKGFFDNFGMRYVEHPTLPGFGMLQIKTTSAINPTKNYVSNTMEHFDKNPNIPVLSSSKIADSLESKYPDGMILGFDKVGLDELAAEKEIFLQLQAVRDIHGDSLINELHLDTGANISNVELDSIADTSMLFGDIGFNSIPALGISLNIAFSSYSNYRRIKNNEISVRQGLKNITTSAAKTAVIGTVSIGASQFLMGNVFNTTSGAEMLEGAETLYAGDFSLEGLEEMGEAALVLAAVATIAYGAKKVWEFFAGDPMEEYKNLLIQRDALTEDMAKLVMANRANIEMTSGIDQSLELKKKQLTIDRLLDEKKQSYLFGTSGIQSLEYYVLEEKDKALSKGSELYSASYGLYTALNRMMKLSKLQKKHAANSDKVISEIINIYTKSTKEHAENVNKLLKKSKVKNTEEAKAYVKILLTNEVDFISAYFKKIYYQEEKLKPIYNISNKYVNHQNKIVEEYKKLQDEGHVK